MIRIFLALIGVAAVAQTIKGYRDFQARAAKGPVDATEARDWDKRWIALNVVATCAGVGVVLVLAVLFVSIWLDWPLAVVYWTIGAVGLVAFVAAMFM